MAVAPTSLDAVCTMAARREEASIDLQQDGPPAPRGDRSAGLRSPVDVAHPTNVASATIKPINAMRLLAVESGRIGNLPGQPIMAHEIDQANRKFAKLTRVTSPGETERSGIRWWPTAGRD